MSFREFTTSNETAYNRGINAEQFYNYFEYRITPVLRDQRGDLYIDR